MQCSTNIKIKIAEKRKLRKEWQKSRSLHDKAKFNKTAKQLKKIINEEQNKAIEEFLTNFIPAEASDYSSSVKWKMG